LLNCCQENKKQVLDVSVIEVAPRFNADSALAGNIIKIGMLFDYVRE